jgi:transcription antitermination factor NusB
MSSGKHGIRELGRELVFLSLYIYDTYPFNVNEITGFDWYGNMAGISDVEEDLLFIPVRKRKEVYKFGLELLSGTISNLARIDAIIKKHLVNWSFSRLHSVDKAILRLAVYSIIYRYDIPAEVTISEANELSNNYSDENSSSYINGILHKVKQEYRKNVLINNA